MAETNATAAIRAKKLPIVIVPGVFGSRLTDPATNQLVWNPSLSHGVFAADDTRMRDLTRPLVPDETHSFRVADDRFPKVLPIKHINNVLFDFYGPIAIAMHHELRKKLAPKNIVPAVFCCGYDFRLDNAVSANRLATVVDEARAACDGEQAIIIAHSMGGLVSRHYCKNMGGQAKVRALVLLASPTHGAPKSYAILRTGDEDLFPLRTVLFQRRETNRQFSRAMPSAYQLMPTFLYSRIDPAWLSFDANQTGFLPTAPPRQDGAKFSDATENFFVFRDIYTGVMDDVALRAQTDTHLQTALNFDSGLLDPAGNTYMHPTTILVHSTKRDTKGKLRVRFDGVSATGANTLVTSDVEELAKVDGDGTVPALSGNPQRVSNEPDRKEVTTLEHSEVPAARVVIDHVMDRIDALF